MSEGGEGFKRGNAGGPVERRLERENQEGAVREAGRARREEPSREVLWKRPPLNLVLIAALRLNLWALISGAL